MAPANISLAEALNSSIKTTIGLLMQEPVPSALASERG
jgi:hypothetical protein